MKIGLKRKARRLKQIFVDAMLDGASAMRVVRSKMFARPSAATTRRRILVVDEMLPDARFGAGYPRAAAIVHALLDEGWEVTMYPMVASRVERDMVRERFAARPVRFFRGRGEKGLHRLMRENLDNFEVTFISRPGNMQIYSRIRTRLPSFRTHCVYDAEAIFATRDLRRLALFGPPMSNDAYERALDAEVALVADADALTTVTEAEALLFRARTAKPVGVIKHSIAVRSDARGCDGRADLLFVGRCEGHREYLPNVDSLHWFVDEVMPLIDARLSTEYRLFIVGLADAEIVSALASDRVIFLGMVDDLNAIYDQCRVFIAPTRFAAGIPLKVVEAAAAGIPCVVTDLLAGQLGFQNDVQLIAARDAEEFAYGCVELYMHPDRWTRIRDAAMRRVEDEYSPLTLRAAVHQVVSAS